MSDNLYGDLPATQPGLNDQMDPLGTANQHVFGQPAPSAEPTLGFGAAPANATIGAAPAASIKIGKVKTKKPLSTGKKVMYGAGGILFAFFALILALDPGPQKINASPTPPATPPVAAEQMGAPGASGDTATLMGGSPAPAPVDAAAGTQSAAVEAPAAAPATAQAPASAPAAAAPVQPAPSPAPAPAPAAVAVSTPAPAPAAVAASTPAPAPAAVAAAAPALAPAAQPVVPKPAAAPPEKLVMVKEKAPAVTPSPDELASRVATLEKRLARYEREEARQRAAAAVAAAEARVAATKTRVAAPAPVPAAMPTATYRPVSASSAVEMRRPAMLSNDSVRVIGVSTRHGVTTALVDFGGVKHRVAAGEAIPGLGTVGSVAVDAGGNPVVEVNGVRYQ